MGGEDGSLGRSSLHVGHEIRALGNVNAVRHGFVVFLCQAGFPCPGPDQQEKEKFSKVPFYCELLSNIRARTSVMMGEHLTRVPTLYTWCML